MAHNELEGNVIGEVWRAQERDKELVYFRVQGEAKWFRIEYTGSEMLERADYMVQKLKAAAASGGGIEVGVDYDELTVGEPPHTPATTFNLTAHASRYRSVSRGVAPVRPRGGLRSSSSPKFPVWGWPGSAWLLAWRR